ncbi:MAG: hypothetical protein H6708_30105 [Kofleriaceae bacterium]|nr:hypothetical protein [Kofleriaceae bacterium]
MTADAADDDPIDPARRHTGHWQFHDDDCRCVEGDLPYCNRGGAVWSCCGACKEHSECTAPAMHPTYWNHPWHGKTISGWAGVWPTYKRNAEIRALLDGNTRGDER